MPAPLVGLAVGAVARAVAKKAAKETVKKVADKAAKKVSTSIKVSPNVKVIPGKMSPTSVRASSVNEKLTSGANQAIKQNAAKTKGSSKSTSKAVKAANKKVSDKNSGIGGATVSAIIKRAEPARANRTRLGKSAFKSK